MYINIRIYIYIKTNNIRHVNIHTYIRYSDIVHPYFVIDYPYIYT